MKFEGNFSPEDLEQFADLVVQRLKPLLYNNGKAESDTLFTVESLAQYLGVDKSWVYKQVSLNNIPYYKIGKYPRFKKSAIDKWLESQSVKPVPSLRAIK